MRKTLLLLPLMLLAGVAAIVCCSPAVPLGSERGVEWGKTTSHTVPNGQRPATPASGGSMSSIMARVNLRQDLVPKGSHGRRVVRPMSPRYITIHSTQNYTADAWKHSLALKRGALRAPKRKGGNRIGYLIWHYTVDDKVAVQHMPTNEQGEHADFDGPGNRYSIGIEMCEHRGSDRTATIDRTARLAAYLMIKHNIPLRSVVPHYHWPRRGAKPPNKNCPHFLLENGRPGRKWRAFLARVDSYYQQMR